SRLDGLAVLVNTAEDDGLRAPHHAFHLRPRAFVSLRDGREIPPQQWRAPRVHAAAGIGNPARFFTTLRALGVEVVEHAFPDHHAYTAADLAFADALPLVMTEKDAVKCVGLDLGAREV